MSKNKVSEWSSNPANNTDVGAIDIAEGCAPSGINNAMREMMAQIKDMQAGLDGDNFTVGGNLSVTGTASGVTPSSSDDSTKFATTEWVQDKVGALGTMSTQNANAVAITGGTVAATFTGNLTGSVTGNVTGNVSGSSGSCTGNSATATLSTNSTNALGYNQTWSNPANSHNTSYQNTTGKPIMVNYGGSSAAKNVWVYLQVSTDNSTWVTVAQAFTSNDDDINGGSLSAIVPANNYYRSTGTAWGNPLWSVLS